MNPSRDELRYDFAAPPSIHFGWGRIVELGRLAAGVGRRALTVWGSRSFQSLGKADQIRRVLTEQGIAFHDLTTIQHEPDADDVDRLAAQIRQLGVREGDFLLAVGGGSAIDLAKAGAALATNPAGGGVKDYLEGVGRGLTLEVAPLPVAAVPTTAGTGSEATRNAVISCHDPPCKKSLRSPLLIPKLVVVDPELSASASRDVTIFSGLDAITQLIESYVSRRARPLPQALVLGALPGAIAALETLDRDGANRPAREAMSHAALVSGIALANSGLGFAHGVAAALGAHLGAPHGLACAVMLPHALRINRTACQEQFAELARVVGCGAGRRAADDADAFVARIEELVDTLRIPRRLRDLGVRPEQLPALAAASRGNSMDGNPRQLSDQELLDILAEMA